MPEKANILIIEDSATQAVKLKSLLKQNGYAVFVAKTGEEGLKQLEIKRPQLAIVDYYLPGVKGEEFCRRVRMNVNTRHIPILMFTADEAEATELKSLESGADDYLPKSADPEILMVRLHTLIRKGRNIGPITGQVEIQSKDVNLLAVDDSPIT